METLYMVCFLVGTVYAMVSFIMNEKVKKFDFDATLKPSKHLFFMKPSIMAVYLIAFGGFGRLFTGITFDFLTAPQSLRFPLALLVAGVVALIVYQSLFTLKPVTDNIRKTGKKNIAVSRRFPVNKKKYSTEEMYVLSADTYQSTDEPYDENAINLDEIKPIFKDA